MAGPADDKPPRSPVEGVLDRSLVDDAGIGKPLSRRAATTQRTVEAYLKAGVRPRWMERVAEIDQGIATERRRLERSYRALRSEYGGDRAALPRRRRELARARPVPPPPHAPIEQHNEGDPGERRPPVNPRNGDYVPGRGGP